MEKEAIADTLEKIATLLELKGENPFKIRAYTNAARSLETWGGNAAALADEEILAPAAASRASEGRPERAIGCLEREAAWAPGGPGWRVDACVHRGHGGVLHEPIPGGVRRARGAEPLELPRAVLAAQVDREAARAVTDPGCRLCRGRTCLHRCDHGMPTSKVRDIRSPVIPRS